MDGFPITLKTEEIQRGIMQLTEGVVGFSFGPSPKRVLELDGNIKFFNLAVVEYESHQ